MKSWNEIRKAATVFSKRWENAYNARRELVSTSYSDGEATQIAYDAFSREACVSNSSATIVYSRDNRGNATNETIAIDGETATINREYDAYGRLVRLNDTHYSYSDDGKLATVSNALATVEYSYSADRMDAGYTVTLPNGTIVARTMARDAYRRSLVTNIVSTVNGTMVSCLAYTYDALGRPTQRNYDSFGYNIRSEAISATISRGSQSSAVAYCGYDEMDNSTWWQHPGRRCGVACMEKPRQSRAASGFPMRPAVLPARSPSEALAQDMHDFVAV